MTLTRLFGSLLGAALIAVVPLASAPALAEPVAVIAAVKGKVEVQPARSRRAQRAVFGRPLERGDKVTVASGGSATVFFNDGNVIELSEKSTMTVGGRITARTVSTPQELPGEVYAQVSKFVTAGSRQSGLVAVSGLRGHAEAGISLQVAPRKTSILTDRPSFAWRAVEGATSYRISITTTGGGELWNREVAASPLAYPSDAPALAFDHEYLWEVEARSAGKSLRRESTVFHVMPSSTVEKVQANLERIREIAGGSDSPASRYVSGSYLFGLGLYHDASEHFGALCKLSPDSPAPHEALGSVYSKIGLMDLAAAEFQQALTLTREP